MARRRPFSSGLMASARSQPVVPPRTNPTLAVTANTGPGGGGGGAPSGPAGGDLTGTYPNPTLAAIGSALGPIGDSSHVSAVSIDTKGRVTALTSVAINLGGINGTAVLAKLTPGGNNGSLVFTNGICTNYVPPT